MSIQNKQPEIPIAQIYPALANVQYVQIPQQYATATPISPQLWGLMEQAQSFSIRQHVKFLPKACCACPPCVQQENTFSIYAGLNTDDQMEVLRADEVSDDWNRCCCAPQHPWKLEVRQYIPVPGDGATSDYAHLSQEVRNDWTRFTGAQQQQHMRDMYKNAPVLFTVLRKDGERCCCKCPCKILSCCVCCACCQDGVSVFAGPTPEMQGKELGRPYNPDPNLQIGGVLQPIFGGGCHPQLNLFEGAAGPETEPYGKIDGPCFFGGWSELCCDFKFFTSFYTSQTPGDIALIVKKAPRSAAAVGQDLCCGSGNFDNYTIQYNTNAKLSAGQKMTVLSAQLLLDYMYFDGNTKKWDWDNDGIYCYFCYCSILGCLVPCELTIPLNQGG